jgi:hypothetical protein
MILAVRTEAITWRARRLIRAKFEENSIHFADTTTEPLARSPRVLDDGLGGDSGALANPHSWANGARAKPYARTNTDSDHSGGGQITRDS